MPMPPQPYRQSRRRIIWAAFLRRTCFGSSFSSSIYTSLSDDSLPLLSEKIPFSPTVEEPPTEKPLPASPPRLTRWPSASNLKARRSVRSISDHNVATIPRQDERTIASFTPKTRSRSISTPETELPDLSSWVAAGGVCGASSFGFACHQPREQEKEEIGEEEDAELGPRGVEKVRFGITVEYHEPQQKVRRERGGVRLQDRREEAFV